MKRQKLYSQDFPLEMRLFLWWQEYATIHNISYQCGNTNISVFMEHFAPKISLSMRMVSAVSGINHFLCVHVTCFILET